jgi:LDH2 family malate/lactate/ureidoglycolate dehydrogenase
MRYSVEDLTQICVRLLTALGATIEETKIIASQLIEANLRGQDGHGVLMLPYYAKQVLEGKFRLGVDVDVIRETPSSALINGNWGFGQIIASKAMELAIAKAQTQSISLVGIFNCNHIGLVAHYPMMALKHDTIGITLCNSAPQVTPYGGRVLAS